MAETHQTEPAVATPPETDIIPSRAQEAEAAAVIDTDAKAAREAKDRMTKTGGFWNRLAPEEEKAKPDKLAEAQPEKPKKEKEQPAAPAEAAATEDEPKEETTKPKKASRKKEPEIDPIELARETGREIGREMAKANKPSAPQPAAPESEPELPEEFRADVAVFEEMSRLDPKRYGNIKKELARYAKAESDYTAKWEEDHPDETYDADAPEHNAFYDKIQPKYDIKDFKAAEKSILKKELRDEVLKETQSREIEAERRREKAGQIQPEVDRDMFSTMGEMIREVDPENADLAKDWASMQTLDEKNPLLADVLVNVHNETKPVVAAAMRLFRSVERFDPNNPAHNRIADMVTKAEQGISRLPIKERYDDDGRLFATQDDYVKMSPDEQARHWYVGEREALALIRGQAIARTKAIYEQKSKEIERYTKRSNATQPNNQASPKKQSEPPQSRPDNGSPSVSGRGTLPGDGQSATNKPTNGRDLFFGRHLGA